jgi:hypothetical protein
MPAEGGGDGDCGICLQPLARLAEPMSLPCSGLNYARRARLDGCSHVFCLACISKWAGIATSCPSCRAAFGEVSMLDDDGEVLQRIKYEQRAQESDDNGSSDPWGLDDNSNSSASGEDEAQEEDYVEFLDDFVVPDDTVEVDDDAASLPSPSAYGRGRRRARRMPMLGDHAQEAGSSSRQARCAARASLFLRKTRACACARSRLHAQSTSCVVLTLTLAVTRRALLDALVQQRRQRQDNARGRPWFRDTLPSDEDCVSVDSDRSRGPI